MSLDDLLRNRKGLKFLRWSDLWTLARPLLVWFGIAAAVFVLFWPAMWVEPLGTLQRMFSQALEYTVEGNRNAIFFNGQVYAGGASVWYYYLVAYLWRASPLVLVGLGLALLALLFRRRLELPALQVRLIAVLFLFAAAYTIFMSLGGQKYDRYLLPVFAPLDLAAGWGWFTWLGALMRRFDRRSTRLAAGVLAAGIVLIQALGLAQSYPYYYTYFNPLLGGLKNAGHVMMLGWGEGLDEAAEYLNSLPEAGKLRVAAWYGDIFAYFFRGVTDGMDENTSLAELQGADYAVLYVQQLQRQVPSPEVLEYFARLTPEYTVRIDGVDYAWVYKLSQAPPD
jgi:4-amino-4-deoxy-L-arabinose transferase-like glycosyltransferase